MAAQNEERRSGKIVGYVTRHAYSYYAERHATKEEVMAFLRKHSNSDDFLIDAILELSDGRSALYSPGLGTMPADLGTVIRETFCDLCGKTVGFSRERNCRRCEDSLWMDPMWS